MNFKRRVIGILSLLSMLVYIVFGNADSPVWSSYFFTCQDIVILFICFNFNHRKDFILKLILWILFIYYFSRLAFDLISFFDKVFFNTINRSYYLGGTILIAIIIYSILSWIGSKTSTKK